MLEAVIIEDEWYSQETLKNMIFEFCDGLEVVAVANSIKTGVEAIRRNRPHIVFLDIEMKDGTGFDLLDQFTTIDFDVIFTTAYNEHALKAFRVNAIDYLLKPVDPDELKQATSKVSKKNTKGEQKIEALASDMRTAFGQHKIPVSNSEGYEFIEVDNIIYCEASGSYTSFILKGGRKLLASKNLKEYEMVLQTHGFYRTHNSYLVNLIHVSKYIKADRGYLIMSNEDEVSISMKRKDALLKRLFPK